VGVDHNAYIGPYLRVTEAVREERTDRCKDHNFPQDAAFCPKCGTQKANRFFTRVVNDAPDDWEQSFMKGGKTCDFMDYLMSTSCMSPPDTKNGKRTYLYTPNCHYDQLKLPRIDGGKYSEEEVPFDKLDINGITQKFTELFAEEIAYLKQWFEVEVKFGYISWCS
jgi:hypothetical protein